MPQTAKLVRKAIESLYIGKCNVYEMQEFKKENDATGHKEVLVFENKPCRLSFSKINASPQQGMIAKKLQVGELFIAPELKIKAGSKIVVTQNGKTTAFKSSGEAAMRSAHQEIMLELFEDYA